MAKKKRKTSGGGAFGKPKTKRVPEVFEDRDDSRTEVERIRRGADHERYMAAMARKDDESSEEGGEFVPLSETLSMEEVLERLDPEPEAHFRAIAHLDETTEEAPEAVVRARAGEALAIDPDCVDAHLLVAEMTEDPEEARRHYQAAVEAGRRKREAILGRATGPSPDPALFVYDLPYLDALFELGDFLWVNGDFEAARDCYREMIAVDPEDTWQARPALLAIAFVLGELEDAEAVLDEGDSANSCSLLYGRAYLEFVRALKASPDFEPDVESDDPFANLRTPAMERARGALRAAIRACPWAAPFLLDSRSILPRPVVSYATGGPFDALEFARLNFHLWAMMGTPAIWLLSEFGSEELPSATKRLLRRRHDEFMEAWDFLEGFEAPELEDAEADRAMGEFSAISRQLAEILEDLGEEPRGRRFRR